MTDKSIEESKEANGRTVEIDTGFYRVQVWGDPEDSCGDMMDMAHEAADRAKVDVKELDESMDDGDNQQYR